MKTILYSVAAIVLSAGTAFSQLVGGDSRGELFFGVKAGLNVSNIYNENSANFQGDAKAGFAGGVFFQLPLNRFIGIQPEILVSMKGYQATDYSSGTTTVTYKRSLSYIDIPVMLQIKPTGFFTLLIGPELSVLVNTTDSHVTTTDNSTTVSSTSEPTDLRKMNAGILAGFDLNIGKHLVIAPRVGWDLLSNNPNDGTTDPDLKNFWFQGCIGLRF